MVVIESEKSVEGRGKKEGELTLQNLVGSASNTVEDVSSTETTQRTCVDTSHVDHGFGKETCGNWKAHFLAHVVACTIVL